jgi:predicted dehydrogenase
MGSRHIENLRRLGFEDICTFSPNADPNKNKDFSSKFGTTHLSSLNEVKSYSPDVVIIASPTHLHLEQILLSKELGAHVFVEKPLGDDLAKAKTLSKAWPEQLVFFQANVLRFHPAVKAIQSFLQQEKLGNLLRAHLHYGAHLEDWHPGEDFRQSYAAKAEMGGGVALTLMHELDLALFFFGNVTRFEAHPLNTGALGIEVEDMVHYTLEHDQIPLVSVHANMVERPVRRQLEIVGSQGRLTYNFEEDALLWHQPDGFVEDLPIPGGIGGKEALDRAYIAELSHFFDAVSGRITSAVGWDEALESLNICIQGRLSP